VVHNKAHFKSLHAKVTELADTPQLTWHLPGATEGARRILETNQGSIGILPSVMDVPWIAAVCTCTSGGRPSPHQAPAIVL